MGKLMIVELESLRAGGNVHRNQTQEWGTAQSII